MLWAFDYDETWTALVIFGVLLVDLVPEAVRSRIGWHWQPVNAINLHWLYRIELSWPLDQFKLGLGLDRKDDLFVDNTEGFLMRTDRDLIRAFVTILSASNTDECLWVLIRRVNDRGEMETTQHHSRSLDL